MDVFEALLDRYPEWRSHAVEQIEGDGWRGRRLAIPPVNPAIEGDLLIEEVEGEITIDLDHCHVHIAPDADPARGIWFDPHGLIGAILSDRVLAASGWQSGRLRVGTLFEAAEKPNLLVPDLDCIRVRSWLGTADRDERLSR